MDYSSFAETNTDATVQMLETPEAAIETATALHQEPDNNLLSGSDVMETTPSIFPAPVDAPETEFRPQLTELEALYEQGATWMYCGPGPWMKRVERKPQSSGAKTL